MNTSISLPALNGSITAPKLDGGQTGSAPIFGIRAWANFNGNNPVTVRGSGNVLAIADLSAGTYRVTFDEDLPNANYTVIAMGSGDGVAPSYCYESNTGNNRDSATISSIDFQLVDGAASVATRASVNVMVVG